MIRVVIVAVVIAACGPRTPRPADGPVPWARSGVDWNTPPTVKTVAWTPPRILEHTLDNGIRILVVENHRLPLVAIAAIHGAAGSREDGTQPGVAALTSDLFARIGPPFEATIATDHAAQYVRLQSSSMPAVIALLEHYIRTPATGVEIDRVRTTRIRELTEHRAQTRRTAAQVFDRVVFGAHPYAQPAEGTLASVAAITPADVRAFFERAYRPDAMTLVVAGDTTLDEVRKHVQHHLGSWRPPSTPLAALPALPAYTAQVAYVDVPGASEANIIIGGRAPAAGDANLLTAELANTIIGSGVEGRLDRELHGKLALTFGASSSFWRGAAGSSWAAAATFDTAKTGAGLEALLQLIDVAHTTKPTADELALARRNMVAAAQLAFETTVGSVRAVERLLVQRQPLDSYATLGRRLAQPTAAQVRDALPLDELSIVIVGDWERIVPTLRTAMEATKHLP